MNTHLILATSSTGKDITVGECLSMLAAKDKKGLANFIYDRLYGRYLKPFEFSDENYIKSYKNGFAIMASCCLLIETYVSFTNAQYRKTRGQSPDCFKYFFLTEPHFKELSTGNLPKDFYTEVRCGILHNAETRNGWAINRRSKTYVDITTKQINAVKFSNRLKTTLRNYKNRLIVSDFDTDDIWINFRNRLSDLIKQS